MREITKVLQTDKSVYRLLEIIGEGGMAVVYSAERQDPPSADKFAVKIFSPNEIWADDLEWNENIRERFVREGQLLLKIDHAHIIPVYETGIDSHGREFLVMPYIIGKNLAEVAGKLPILVILKIARQIVSALAKIHPGIIHRDVKPENIILTKNFDAYLMDLGICKIYHEKIHKQEEVFANLAVIESMQDKIVGTPDYISPEQILPDQYPLTVCCDQFSLGALLYNLMTNYRPFPGIDFTEILMKIISEPIEKIEESDFNIDRKLLHDFFEIPTANEVKSKGQITVEKIVAENRVILPAILPQLNKFVQKLTEKHPINRYENMMQVDTELLKIIDYAKKSFGS